MIKRFLPLLLLLTSAFSQSTNILNNTTIFPNTSIGGTGSIITLISVQISPVNVTIPFTQSQTFNALGIFSNGTQSDITALATWTSSNNTIASPQGTPPGNNLYQCNNRGTVTITATYQSIGGNTLLTCQSPTFTPTGSINTTQSASPTTIVQFVGANGTAPFTFSSIDLPGFLSLSNSGCSGSQINCSLFGTPATVGVFSFHVQATDNLGNTACVAPGCQIFLNVTSASAEDNNYCDSTNHVIGLPQDGPALPLVNCYNTALVNTPTTVGNTVFVCPQGQVGVAQCALTTLGSQPQFDTCYTTGGVWCPSVQSAVTYLWNSGGTPRCWDIEIYATNDDTPGGTPNDYTAPTVEMQPISSQVNTSGTAVTWVSGNQFVPAMVGSLVQIAGSGGCPGINCYTVVTYNSAISVTVDSSVGTRTNVSLLTTNMDASLNCGPQFSRNYAYIRTKQFNNLPPPGNRITPSWLNQSSVNGYKTYTQTTQFGIASGTYLPKLRAEATSNGSCLYFNSQQFGILNGIRFMGLWLSCAHGRDTSTDVWSNHVCPPDLNGSFNCYPGGAGGGLIFLGCNQSATIDCSASHAYYDILDRVIISGCDDISLLTCYGDTENLYVMDGGDYQAVIDSTLIQGFCMYGIGPCVESHGISGGNIPGSQDDKVFKAVDNIISATSVDWFSGGGPSVSGFFPTDREFRRNNLYKPLTWKPDDTAFVGKVQDTFINAQNGANQGFASCSGTALTWVSGNKFNLGMQGNQISFNGSSFTVTTFNNGQLLTLGSSCTAGTNPYIFPASNAYGIGSTCSVDPPLSGTTALCNVVLNKGLIVDVTISNKGSGYGMSNKANGNTALDNPGFYITDGVSGLTYASCGKEPAGQVNTSGFAVTWVHGKKFIPGMAQTYMYIAPSPSSNNPPTTCNGATANCYKIVSEGPNTSITLDSGGPSPGTLTNVDYQAYIPSNNDCIRPMTGIPNVKSHTEMKQVVRLLYEGNVLENSWTGASDQDGFSFVLAPRNANNVCPTCIVSDVTIRYNLSRRSNKGISMVASIATQGESFSLGVQRVSVHDDLFDGLNGFYQTVGTSPIQSSAMAVVGMNNGDTDGAQPQDIKINHISAIGTIQSSFVISQSGFLNLNFNCQYIKNNNLPTIWPGMTAENSIAYGGARNSATKNTGCIQCAGLACSDQKGHGPTESALRQIWSNDFDLPKASGNYTGNQITGLLITSGGTCSSITSCTIADPPTGHANVATCGFTTKGTSPNITLNTLFPVFPGANYTTLPSVSFGGSCSVAPVVTIYMAGQNYPATKSGCYDHNGMVLQAWTSIVAMNPYPTAQLDPVNNSCDSNTGGTNLTVNHWTDVKFTNFASEGGAGTVECNGDNCPTGDYHLQGGSPFHNAANDGRDMGADMDKVIGTSSGTPSPFTGCFIVANSYTCP